MKHAYLILAHSQFGFMRYSVSCLESSRSEVGFHFDRMGCCLSELNLEYAHPEPHGGIKDKSPLAGFRLDKEDQGMLRHLTAGGGHTQGWSFVGRIPQLT